MATKTLVLVRHGQYSPKTEGSEERLTALGRKQARLVGQRLKEHKFDKIHCSTMPRAIETADTICSRLGARQSAVQTHNLRECVPGFPPQLRKNMVAPTLSFYANTSSRQIGLLVLSLKIREKTPRSYWFVMATSFAI